MVLKWKLHSELAADSFCFRRIKIKDKR